MQQYIGPHFLRRQKKEKHALLLIRFGTRFDGEMRHLLLKQERLFKPESRACRKDQKWCDSRGDKSLSISPKNSPFFFPCEFWRIIYRERKKVVLHRWPYSAFRQPKTLKPGVVSFTYYYSNNACRIYGWNFHPFMRRNDGMYVLFIESHEILVVVS